MKINIFSKVLLIFLSFLIGISSSLFFSLRHQTRLALQSQINERLVYRSSTILNSIDRFIYERINDLKSLKQKQLLISADRPDFNTYDTFFKNELAINELYESFTLFDTNRVRIYDSNPAEIGKKHKDYLYWKDLKEAEYAIDISYSQSRKKKVIHFAYKIRDEQGKYIGVLVARVLASKIENIFKDLIDLSETGKNMNIKLINQDGIILYDLKNKDKKQISKQTYYPYYKENYDIIHEGNIEQKLFSTNDSLFFLCRERGYLNYKGSHWTLVIGVAEDDVFFPLKSLEDNWKIILLLLIVLATLLSAFIAKRFAKSIHLMKQATEYFGQGKFDLKLQINTKDEREDLAKGISKMAKQLEKMIHLQLIKNQNLSQENQKLHFTSNELKIENENLNASIKYASLIQKGLLPNKENLKNSCFDIAIINKPLKTIGGDFYFFEEIRPKEFLFITIDCTGHGVPGAILTIIAHNIIKEVLSKESSISPNLIMDQIHKYLLNGSLKKGEFTLNEGMDASIVLVDTELDLLKYSGSFGSLIYLEDEQINQIKGERIPLGSNFEKHKNHTYKLVTLDLKKINKFYLYTDGIVDQLGEINGRKYSAEKAKKILFETRNKNITEQIIELNDNILEWRGSEIQTDDMLILGIDLSKQKKQLSNIEGCSIHIIS